MRGEDILDFVADHWHQGLAPAIGALVTIAVAYLGFRLFRRRPPAAPSPTITTGRRLDPFALGASRERRVAPRRTGNPIKVLLTDVGLKGQPEAGLIIDRSLGGLGILTRRYAAPGALLAVRAAAAPVTVPWTEVEVRSCLKEGSDWKMGCKYIKSPGTGVLLYFG